MSKELRFEWDYENVDIGSYTCNLYDGDEKIDEISFIDYTSEFHQRYDREGRYTRPYSFVVDWCHGWSMSEGFDYDEDYNRHSDEKGWRIGGYQGNCTHTVDDIKRWCENWLAQRYLQSYYNTLKGLDEKRRRAEWFESQGFALEEEDNE